jgi:hypothetical protein
MRSWWEEYFVDNPIAWLLHRQVGYANRLSMSSELQQVEKSLRAARQARDTEALHSLLQIRGEHLRGMLTPQSFWKRYDRIWALGLWGLAVLIALACYSWGVQGFLRQQLRIPHFWFIFVAILLIPLIGYGGALKTLLVQERERSTADFLWLTRLTGQHLVYGVLTVLAMQILWRPFVIFFTPFIWLVGTLMWDSGLRGIWLVVQWSWLWGTFALLWLVMGVFIIAPPLKSLTGQMFELAYGLVGVALLLLSLPFFSGFATMRPGMPVPLLLQVDQTPLWSWWRLPLWWLSLSPPVGLVSLLFVSHPLWGLLQGLVYAGLTALLLPFAVACAERARLRPMPEVLPEEGDW